MGDDPARSGRRGPDNSSPGNETCGSFSHLELSCAIRKDFTIACPLPRCTILCRL